MVTSVVCFLPVVIVLKHSSILLKEDSLTVRISCLQIGVSLGYRFFADNGLTSLCYVVIL